MVLSSDREHRSANDVAHNLVGPLQNLMHAHVAKVTLRVVLLDVAVAPMHLQGAVADLEAHVRRESLGHGTLRRAPRVFVVEHLCGVEHHQSCGCELCGHICDLEAQVLELVQGVSK
eukprot:CAMPEP_0170192284 /NCGR_PEP_ID=MMETSP0040_2-20121228/53756_1 /TAXON_ID=641309 /ORGANISM="Lotharella oceanica, Strain CCMP622" /LENGTH=116 /DNA_ID=CAMNT_0010440595 /DNA_START=366 /DNA_END=713 /DNA_ORIENTATION=-